MTSSWHQCHSLMSSLSCLAYAISILNINFSDRIFFCIPWYSLSLTSQCHHHIHRNIDPEPRFSLWIINIHISLKPVFSQSCLVKFLNILNAPNLILSTIFTINPLCNHKYLSSSCKPGVGKHQACSLWCDTRWYRNICFSSAACGLSACCMAWK